MYDKYFQANTITTGSKIPKHKGILVLGGTAGGPTFSTQLLNQNGLTFNVTMSVTQSPQIIPMQVYAVNAFNGLTGFWIS